MKKNILLYLLLFSLLVNVFQYVNSKSIIDKYETDIHKFKTKIEKLENLVCTRCKPCSDGSSLIRLIWDYTVCI